MKTVLVVIILVICFANSAYSRLLPKHFGEKLLRGLEDASKLCKLYTGTTDALIDGATNGQFPDDEPSIQRYTLCLWISLGELDNDFKIIKPKLLSYLTDLNRQDAVHYITCNEKAINLPEKDPVKKIWEMQKCIYKTIDNERYIYY